MKIQTKIAVLFATLAGGILLAVSLFIYYLTNQNTFEDFYKRLEIRAVIAAKVAFEKVETSADAFSQIRAEHLEKLPSEKEYFIRVDSLFYDYADKKKLELPDDYYQKIINYGKASLRHHNIFYSGIYYKVKGGDYIVIISAKNELSLQYLFNLRRALIICFAIAVVLSFTVGLAFSKEILKPIRKITSKAKDISAHNLHLRLDIKAGEDEIATLSATINNMLDRLETAFETQNNFVSHASHELNTPLTAIIGETEYVLSKPRDCDQYVQSLRSVQEEAEKLRRIIKSLLQLAQTGFGGKLVNIKRLRIDEMMYKVKQTVDNIIPNNQVFINHSLFPEDEKKLIIYASHQLLELALSNIVLNAVKYSSNSPVQFALAASNDAVIIMIKDTGIGIPKDELKYIYDPFFRASNTGHFKGYGIGLPLARNIIRMHQGELIVNSTENEGTEIQVVLPLPSNALLPVSNPV
jgi:signal transduction histidine kinase